MTVLPPSSDPFYDAAVPAGEPGALLRQRRVPSPGAIPTVAWQVVHTSTATGGAPSALSGSLLVPRADWTGRGPRPILSYGVGVHGLSRDAAPSHWLRRGSEPELPLLDRALARGWAVALSDGEGLGLPGPHTYGAGVSGGRAMLDVVRAARVLEPDLADSPVVAWGYSEGGRCAVFAAEEQPTYAPDLPLVGIAAGGVPSDLRVVAKALDDGPLSGLNLAVLVGLAHAHDRAELWRILTPEGRAAARRAVDLDVVGLVLQAPVPLARHTVRDDPWDDLAWRAVLDEERAGQRAPQVPTYLYHVVGDEIVPDHLVRELAATYRARGADVTVVDVVADDHLSGATVAAPRALEWLAARLEHAGSPGRLLASAEVP